MELFREILSFDSTSGRERELGEWLAAHLEAPSVETFEVGDGTLNVLLRWGEPRVVFCSHMDTVPPYLPPVFGADRVCGRGTCDAKGQFYAMYRACRRLAEAGRSGFALLILSGEETARLSSGGPAWAQTRGMLTDGETLHSEVEEINAVDTLRERGDARGKDEETGA